MTACSKCGREKPWPEDCSVHLDEISIVERPSITVTASRGSGAAPVSYDANQLALVSHDARWHLAFVSSGSLVLIPVADVIVISIHTRGATWCMACDQRLTAYPSNDPSYHRVVKKEPA